MKLPTHRKTKGQLRSLFPCLFLVQTLFAQQTRLTLVYSDSTTRIETSPYAAVLEDVKAEWTIEQVRAMPDSCFHQSKAARLNLIFSTSRFWVRFSVENKTKEDLFFLNLVSTIEYMDMYVVSEDGHLTVYPPSGLLRPFENRALQIHNINFNLGKKPKTIFVAIKTNQLLYFSNYVGIKDAVYDLVRLDERIFFFTFGLYFILAIYNLAIYFNSRDIPFFWYAMFQSGAIVYFLYYFGFGYEYLWRYYPFMNKDSGFHVAVAVIPACIFSMSFLNTRNIIPRFHIYLKTLVIAYLSNLLLQLLGFWVLSNNITQFLNFTIYLSIWIAGWLVYFKGHKTARFYLMGWTIYVFSVIITVLFGTDLIPQFAYLATDNYAINIGATCEAVFLAFALADRIREIRQQARDAQQLLLKQSQEYEELVEKHNHLLETQPPSVNNDPNDTTKRLEALMLSLRAERDTIRKISIPTMEGIILLPMSDLVRIEALGSYAVFYLSSGKKITASRPIGDFETVLPDTLFFRTHKSHIVNLNCVERYIRGEGGSVVLNDGTEIGVSRTAKVELMKRLRIV